ncbi:hypothetical protein [Roseibium sediminicola]|uniref:Uncharacterized protein n=1 Tax=Roseibium sediminicola TaxID=2933272 RepID=A0ABT0GQ76_9HYPH|nr:hypothetical protein [Roseibium sp. CAU 1639]MCK7611596.1 hypothetical protein [Roseibium sp. CAU 1639]
MRVFKMGRGPMFAGLIGALATWPALAQETQPAGGDPAPPPTYDFVQQAGEMTFDGSNLTLTDANTGVLFFSDRPYRLGGQVSNEDFAAYWQKPDGFEGDPPNAVVSVLSETGKAPALLELTSAKTEGSSVVYGVKVLRGELPESAKGVALFIDRSSRPPRGGHHGTAQTAEGGVGFEPYGPYCYHAPQDPRCRAWHHPYHPYYPPYHPYPPYGPYYHPGAAYAAGVAAGAAMANANKPPVYYYYPIPTGPLPANCWINSQHTQMVCSVPLQ